jgi:hypothetical protein
VATRPPFCHSANPEAWCKSSLDRVTLRGVGKCPTGSNSRRTASTPSSRGNECGRASNSSSMAGRESHRYLEITCVENGWETVRFEIVILTIVANRVRLASIFRVIGLFRRVMHGSACPAGETRAYQGPGPLAERHSVGEA